MLLQSDGTDGSKSGIKISPLDSNSELMNLKLMQLPLIHQENILPQEEEIRKFIFGTSQI